LTFLSFNILLQLHYNKLIVIVNRLFKINCNIFILFRLLVAWSPGHLVTWSPGQLVTWLPGCLVAWSPGYPTRPEHMFGIKGASPPLPPQNIKRQKNYKKPLDK